MVAAAAAFVRTNARHRRVLQVVKTLLSVSEGEIISTQSCAVQQKQNFAKCFFFSVFVESFCNQKTNSKISAHIIHVCTIQQ